MGAHSGCSLGTYPVHLDTKRLLNRAQGALGGGRQEASEEEEEELYQGFEGDELDEDAEDQGQDETPPLRGNGPSTHLGEGLDPEDCRSHKKPSFVCTWIDGNNNAGAKNLVSPKRTRRSFETFGSKIVFGFCYFIMSCSLDTIYISFVRNSRYNAARVASNGLLWLERL